MAALGADATGALGCGAEPPLKVADSVDLSRFQGKWYEIAKLPRITQTNCYGTTAFYTKTSDQSLELVNQCNLGSNFGPISTVTMNAWVPDTAAPAKLALQVGAFSGDYWILEVGSEYEYAVIGHPSRLYFWILSRAPQLDSTTVQGIVARAKSNQFDMSPLEYTPQPSSGERVASPVPVGTVPPALTTGCDVHDGGVAGAGNPGLLGGVFAIAAAVRRRAHRRRSRAACSRTPTTS
jgi:apolipoprotein D and lipocalin family protein